MGLIKSILKNNNICNQEPEEININIKMFGSSDSGKASLSNVFKSLYENEYNKHLVNTENLIVDKEWNSKFGDGKNRDSMDFDIKLEKNYKKINLRILNNIIGTLDEYPALYTAILRETNVIILTIPLDGQLSEIKNFSSLDKTVKQYNIPIVIAITKSDLLDNYFELEKITTNINEIFKFSESIDAYTYFMVSSKNCRNVKEIVFKCIDLHISLKEGLEIKKFDWKESTQKIEMINQIKKLSNIMKTQIKDSKKLYKINCYNQLSYDVILYILNHFVLINIQDLYCFNPNFKIFKKELNLKYIKKYDFLLNFFGYFKSNRKNIFQIFYSFQIYEPYIYFYPKYKKFFYFIGKENIFNDYDINKLKQKNNPYIEFKNFLNYKIEPHSIHINKFSDFIGKYYQKKIVNHSNLKHFFINQKFYEGIKQFKRIQNFINQRKKLISIKIKIKFIHYKYSNKNVINFNIFNPNPNLKILILINFFYINSKIDKTKFINLERFELIMNKKTRDIPVPLSLSQFNDFISFPKLKVLKFKRISLYQITSSFCLLFELNNIEELFLENCEFHFLLLQNIDFEKMKKLKFLLISAFDCYKKPNNSKQNIQLEFPKKFLINLKENSTNSNFKYNLSTLYCKNYTSQ